MIIKFISRYRDNKLFNLLLQYMFVQHNTNFSRNIDFSQSITEKERTKRCREEEFIANAQTDVHMSPILCAVSALQKRYHDDTKAS